MIKTRPLRTRGPSAVPVSDDAIGIFLTSNGKLPGFAQRRLDDLLAKQQTEGLTRKEQRELSEALDYIDAKTTELLEYRLSARGRSTTKSGRHQATATRRSASPKRAGRGNGNPQSG